MKWMWVGVAAAVVVVAAPAGRAAAEEVKAVKKVEDMNRAAMEDYDLLEFESAKKRLNEALVSVKKNKLEKHPVAAKIHMNLGIIAAGGMQDKDTALIEFMNALEIDPGAKLDKAYKNKQLQAIFDEAKANVGGGGGEPVIEVPGITGLQHTPVDEANSGQDIKISLDVGADVKAKQVVLYYRAQGAENFDMVAMKSDDGVKYTGSIPAAATGGSSLHYYIEAKNAAGKVTATNGNPGSPNIVMLEGGTETGDGGDDENPLDLAARVGGGGGGGNGGSTTIKKSGGAKGKKTLFVNVAIGAGGGFVSGKTEVSSQDVACCVAPAPFHVMPEIGFFLNPRTTLSAYGRIGFVFDADAEFNNSKAATAGPAGFLRLAYSLAPAGGGLQLHGDVGGGFIRHRIPLNKGDMSAVMGSVDTSATGPLFVGGGAKWEKALGNALRFTADLNMLIGIPVTGQIGTARLGFAINFDVNLGLAVAF
jgi:hypothetical protein